MAEVLTHDDYRIVTNGHGYRIQQRCRRWLPWGPRFKWMTLDNVSGDPFESSSRKEAEVALSRVLAAHKWVPIDTVSEDDHGEE